VKHAKKAGAKRPRGFAIGRLLVNQGIAVVVVASNKRESLRPQERRIRLMRPWSASV
jgi:hypothetical protein